MAVRNPTSFAVLPALAIFGLVLTAMALPAKAGSEAFLSNIKKHQLLTSTSPDNGDQNPYALVVAPVSAGSVQKNDVLIDNFNNNGNLQGTGSTIVDYRPSTGQMTTFAAVPSLPNCPGGVGLTTAMTMLKSGWVIVGSAPSRDGTSKTLGQGCLIVLDSSGKVAATITDPLINDPWGNMAVIDNGDTAKIFVSNVGFDIGNSGATTVHNKATVLRLDLRIPAGQKPEVTAKTVIADGLSSQADPGVFLIGPTGLVLGGQGQLYVSDAINNRVISIPDAASRTSSAGTGTEITKDGFLNRPLALAMAPNGHLLVINGLDGYVVEVDPANGRQLTKKLIDGDQAQTPPGSGDLFGIAMAPDGKGFYYVEDDVNTLVEAK